MPSYSAETTRLVWFRGSSQHVRQQAISEHLEELEGFSGNTRFNPRAFSGSDQSHRQNGSPCKPGLNSNKRTGIDFNTRSSIGAGQTDTKHRCTHTTAHCVCLPHWAAARAAKQEKQQVPEFKGGCRRIIISKGERSGHRGAPWLRSTRNLAASNGARSKTRTRAFLSFHS